MFKNLTQKYSHVNEAMDRLVQEANSEMELLQKRIGGIGITQILGILPIKPCIIDLHLDRKEMQKRNAQLLELCKQKAAKQKQVQTLYDALKQKVMLGQVETAALNDLEQTLDVAARRSRPEVNYGTDTYPVKDSHARDDSRGPFGREPNVQTSHDFHSNCQRARNGSQRSAGAAIMPPPENSHGAVPSGEAECSTIFTLLTALPAHPNHTPIHRAHLPGTLRATANRSQIPMSSSRLQNVEASSFNGRNSTLRLPHGGSSRHGLRSTVNSRGISTGMRVGTAENLDQLNNSSFGGREPPDRPQLNTRGHQIMVPTPVIGTTFH